MSNEAANYTIKRLQPDNIADISRLHQAVYQRGKPSDFFINKYNTAYTGVKHIGFIAYNDAGVPIAFYAVIPCFLQHGNKKVLTAQSADTMTHPDYRNKGLFVMLANLTYELCRENNIRIVFGFPNQNSLPGFIDKLGWEITDTMETFIIPVHQFNWELAIKKLPCFNRLYPFYTSYILKKHYVNQYGVTNSALHDGHDGVYRNDSYLKYKNYNATTVIQVNRALVWLKVNNGLIIGDMSMATENFNAVMRSVTQLARRLGVKQILFQSSPGTKLHRLFSDKYWSAPSFQVIFKDMGSRLPLKQIKFTTADIDTF